METSLLFGWAEEALPNGVGLDLSGFLARENPSIGQRDPLFARAMCLRDGKNTLVWASVDVLALGRAFVERIRMKVSDTYKIPPRSLCIAATHTHSAPATIFLAGCGIVDRDWIRAVQETIERVLARAIEDATRRVRLRFAQKDVPGYTYNRRTHNADGSPKDGVLHGGHPDTTLSTITAYEWKSGRPCAAVVHYACHPVFFRDRMISADWPGRMGEALQKLMGADFHPLFIQGACGNVNPLRPTGDSEVDLARMADGLAHAASVLIADRSGSTRLTPKLNARLRPVWLPLEGYPEEEVLRSYVLSPEVWTRSDRRAQAFHLWAKRLLSGKARNWWQKGVRMPVQVMNIGEVSIVALGAEVFTQTAHKLREEHPERPILVAGYANDAVGYLPPAEEYPRNGYEVEEAYRFYGFPTRFAPEAEEIARTAADTILKMRVMAPPATHRGSKGARKLRRARSKKLHLSQQRA